MCGKEYPQNKDLKKCKFMCDKNFSYFEENFDKLYSENPEKFIVIKNKSVIGSYDSFEEAYLNTKKTENLGSFLIQHCTMNDVNYFCSNNVAFTGV